MAPEMTLKTITTCIILLAAVNVVVVPTAEAVMGCGQVVQFMSPCIPYVTGQGPLGTCCGGVNRLYSAASTTPDRQSVCKCLKSLASSYNIDLGKAGGLPSQCGVSIPYKINPSTDCAKGAVSLIPTLPLPAAAAAIYLYIPEIEKIKSLGHCVL
ncbi:hypothetical protein OROMI_029207 [Orobanche minor]